ncbi:MAG TPA: extracellular solute-binding protein [Candidatus Paceibacterota bacterium]
MRFTRSQLVILGVISFFVVVAIGMLTGIIPGLRTSEDFAPELELNVWGVFDDNYFYENFAAYNGTRRNVTINYKQIDAKNYENILINAIAAGAGPDVFMFHSSWLPKHSDKITPAPNTLTLEQFRGLFPTVAEQDFAPDKVVYALPLYIDTLALYYNEEIFDSAAIAIPPRNWLEFQNIIPKLRQINPDGQLARSAAAIGGTNTTTLYASDVLSLLMLQSGTQMTDPTFSRATFAESVNGFYTGLDALQFYTKFTNAKDIYYAWDESLGNAIDAFAQGKTAMIFGYRDTQKLIQEKSPLLRFKATAMPQPNLTDPAVNYADYWGLAVSAKSQWPTWGWDLIQELTTNETAVETFLQTSGLPPALRTLIQKYSSDPDLGIFARQALTARSWPQINKQLIAQIFSQMIAAVVNQQLDPREAITQAENEVTGLMQVKGP